MTAGSTVVNVKLMTYYGKQSRLSLTLLGFVLVGLIGIIDYQTGYELSFSIFYLIPMSLAAWQMKRGTGMLMAGAGAIVWLVLDLLGGHPYSHPAIAYWNASVRLGFFLIVVYALTELRMTQARKAELIAELQTTLAKVKLLEGILPICCYCKKIRDENNQWYMIEGYVTNHSEAKFTHTFCPECVKDHYPDCLSELTDG